MDKNTQRGDSMNIPAAILVAGLCVMPANASARNEPQRAAHRENPIVLAQSGGFVIGGKVIANAQGKHQSCDHGYVEYFLPANPRSTSLVMWHSSSTQVWQNRWDGGEGYKDMFLRRDYPVYLWDGPRVGRANWNCETITSAPIFRDEQNFTSWNFGPSFGNWWPDVQFPTRDPQNWQNATAARYDEFDLLRNIHLETDAAAVAADSGRLGHRIVYLTNSAGGLRAMVTTTKASGSNIAGMVTYESIGYVFPLGDPESPAPCTNQDACPFGPIGVPLEDFRKLAKLVSIQFVWGDHRSGPDAAQALYVEQSRLCAKLINKYGGHAEVLMLGDDAGLKGSTHIPFADMDNDKVAALLDQFLKKAKLDGYGSAKPKGHWVWDN
ncbi:MAG: alpha/beta fold hydrolase [Pseudomonadota bacterium]